MKASVHIFLVQFHVGLGHSIPFVENWIFFFPHVPKLSPWYDTLVTGMSASIKENKKARRCCLMLSVIYMRLFYVIQRLNTLTVTLALKPNAFTVDLDSKHGTRMQSKTFETQVIMASFESPVRGVRKVYQCK